MTLLDTQYLFEKLHDFEIIESHKPERMAESEFAGVKRIIRRRRANTRMVRTMISLLTTWRRG